MSNRLKIFSSIDVVEKSEVTKFSTQPSYCKPSYEFVTVTTAAAGGRVGRCVKVADDSGLLRGGR